MLQHGLTPEETDRMILPLPLAPFENYMLTDDRLAYPMAFFIRLRFAGRFDRPTLEAAMPTALSRHPLLAATVHRSGHRWFWKPAEQGPVIHWRDESPGEAFPNCDPLDVRVAPGMRVIALEGSGRTDLVAQVHHACSDGLGTLGFLEDLLICYAQLGGLLPKSALPPLDPQKLRDRDKLGLTARAWPGVLTKQAAALPGAYRFLARRCESLVDGPLVTSDNPRPADYPTSLTRRLGVSETAAVMNAARTRGVTVNDLLTREFFLALASHCRSRSCGRGRARFRACVPVNLRPLDAETGSAANAVSYVFLDRYLTEMEDPERLLASIHDEMEMIKRCRLGLTFALSLGLCHRLPGVMNWMCQRRRCMATGVIANLGRVYAQSPLTDEQGRLAVGETVLEDVEVLSTWRPLTAVALAAVNYAGRLTIALNYDPRVLSADEAREFIDHFTVGVDQSVA
jgi:hypothetical protein